MRYALTLAGMAGKKQRSTGSNKLARHGCQVKFVCVFSCFRLITTKAAAVVSSRHKKDSRTSTWGLKWLSANYAAVERLSWTCRKHSGIVFRIADSYAGGGGPGDIILLVHKEWTPRSAIYGYRINNQRVTAKARE
jgi:hypothetical protein